MAWCVAGLVWLSCGGQPTPPVEAPTETSPPPVDADRRGARMIGRGVVSTEAVEFAWSESPDGREAYFNRAPPDRSSFAIYVTRRDGDTWSAPVVAPFSGTYLDADPFVTADGERLFFSSNRPDTPGGEAGDFNLWVVRRAGDAWGEPERLPDPINGEGTEIYSTLTTDGTLYFNSDRSGERLVYRAAASGDGFATPELVAIPGPHGKRPSNPAIAPDGQSLVFVDTFDGNATSGDLFVTRRTGTGWADPERLSGDFNSTQSDFAPCYSADGARLTFTSERPGVVGARPAGERPPGDLYELPAP